MPGDEKVADEYIVLMRAAYVNHGPRCLILMQVGSFYEIYDNLDPELSPQLQTCDRVLYLKVGAKKMTSIVDGENKPVFFAGFPVDALQRYKTMLIDNRFTVLIISQDEKDTSTRRLTSIVSPGFDDRPRDSAAAVLVVSDGRVAIARYDVAINRIDLFETEADNISRALDEARMLLCEAGGASEIQIHVADGVEVGNDERLAGPFDNAAVHIKRHDKRQRYLYDRNWQIRSLESHFKKYFTVGDTILSKLCLESTRPAAILAIVLLAIFVRQHDPEVVAHLPIPNTRLETYAETRVLNGSLHALDIVESSGGPCLLDFLAKHVRTKMGLRQLRTCLCTPIHDVAILNQRYDEIEAMTAFVEQNRLDAELRRIKDLDAMASAMHRGKVRTLDIERIVDSHRVAHVALKMAGEGRTSTGLQALQDMIDACHQIFDFERHDWVDIFRRDAFRVDVVDLSHVNALRDKFEGLLRHLEEICAAIETTVPGVQLRVNTSGSFQLTTSAARGRTLMQHGYSVHVSAKDARLNDQDTIDACEAVRSARSDLDDACADAFKSVVAYLCRIYFDEHAEYIAACVGRLDLVHGIARLAMERNYTRPILVEATHSAIKASQLRHPIIEHLVDARGSRYVSNDIELDCRNSMLLYGVNSVGKSSLLKAVAIAVLMAQAGFFVAATSFRLVPYTAVSLHVGGRDDMYRSQSTFVRELEHLRVVLRASRSAGSRMLFLADELGNSTEDSAAVRIVSTVLHTMYTRATTIVLATHMFALLDNPHVKGLRGLRSHHLKVSFPDTGGFVFERTLQPGPPTIREYGCEIAARLLEDDADFSRRLRSNWHDSVKPITTEPRPSRYNRRLFADCCAICNYAPSTATDEPLAWHHIDEQRLQVDGFTPSGRSIHASSNQMPVCRPCHKKIHDGLINIIGYEETDMGRVLKLAYCAA